MHSWRRLPEGLGTAVKVDTDAHGSKPALEPTLVYSALVARAPDWTDENEDAVEILTITDEGR